VVLNRYRIITRYNTLVALCICRIPLFDPTLFLPSLDFESLFGTAQYGGYSILVLNKIK